MADDNKTDVDINTSGLKKGEKFVYKRDEQGRVTEVQKKSTGRCWVATAYYGSPSHVDVCTLRKKRNQLMAMPFLGFFITQINSFYCFIGDTPIGQDWAKKASKKGTIQNKVSAFICKSLLKISR